MFILEKKIRVLHIAFNDLGNGGIQNQIMAIARNTEHQVKNDIIVWSSKPAYYDEEFQQYGSIIRIPHYEGKSYLKRKLDFFTRYFRIKKEVINAIQENGHYDVVHSHKLFESAACLSAAHKAGVPTRIAHAHLSATKGYKMTPVRFVIKIYNAIYRRIIRKHATHMIGCSRNAADYVFGKNHGEIVHIGIDLSKFDASKYKKNQNAKKRILHVGHFSVHKNQLFLIDVLNELINFRKDIEIVLVGKDSAYKRDVEEKLAENGLSDYVVFKPHDSNVPQEMNDADLFVFPSNYEGFGIVLVEAQSMGLRCIASTEVPKETDCGLVTYLPLSNGAHKWAKCIDNILQEDWDRKPANVNEFSETQMAKKMLDIYRLSIAEVT